MLSEFWDNWQSATKQDVIDFSSVLVSARVKLIVAYAMNGQTKNVFTNIHELEQIIFLKKILLYILALAGYFNLGRKLINLLWKRRQKQSFNWYKPSENVLKYFEKIGT